MGLNFDKNINEIILANTNTKLFMKIEDNLDSNITIEDFVNMKENEKLDNEIKEEFKEFLGENNV